MERRVKKIKAKFRFCKSFAIIGHKDPDGDALFSALAMKHWLEITYKKPVNLFFDGQIPKTLEAYIPKSIMDNINTLPTKDYSTVIVLDSPKPDRLGKFATILKKRWVLNIDHHIDNTYFGTVNIVFPSASSTGEILWFFFRSIAGGMMASIDSVFDSEMLKDIYIAALTDTAGFTSSSTTSRTHRMVFEIQAQNFFMVDEVRRYFFGENAKSKAILTSKALSTLKFYENDTITIMRLTYSDFQSSDAEFFDSVGIINQGINIAGVYVAAIFIEREDLSYYVSIRTKNDLPAYKLAQRFGGGGHGNMAAFQYVGELDELINKFVSETSQFIKEITGRDFVSNTTSGDLLGD